MKHASRSATACRLHPEIPHPCKSASSVRPSVLAQSAIYFPLDRKLPLPQTHIFLSLFRSILQAENVPRPCYLCHSQLGNTVFRLLTSFSSQKTVTGIYHILYVYCVRHTVFEDIFFFLSCSQTETLV